MRKEVKIGIFAILILFGLYWGISFLKGKDLFRKTHYYYAYYDNVSGIQTSTPIIIQGIGVGAVTKITFLPEKNNSIELQLNVKSAYKIPANSIARIVSNGIIGGKAIEIELGDSDVYLENKAVINSVTNPDLLEIAGSEFDYFKKKAGELMHNLNNLLEGINTVIEDNDQSINSIVRNIESMSATAHGALNSKADSLALIIDNLTVFSNALAGGSDKLGEVMLNLNDISGTLAEADLGLTIAKLNDAADGINQMLDKINNAEGSLGALVNDRALYDSLTVASANLSSLLKDIEENPGRYVRVSVFGGGKNKK